MSRHTLLCAALAIASSSISACASSGTGKGLVMASEVDATNPAAPRSRTQITAAEMRGTTATTLYEVVQRLRPEWLSSRGVTTLGAQSTRSGQAPENGVQVYIDTQQAGTVDVLRQLPIGSAASLRYYSAADAQTRFGLGNMGGVIQVLQTTPATP
jgi:hypothetical protein